MKTQIIKNECAIALVSTGSLPPSTQAAYACVANTCVFVVAEEVIGDYRSTARIPLLAQTCCESIQSATEKLRPKTSTKEFTHQVIKSLSFANDVASDSIYQVSAAVVHMSENHILFSSIGYVEVYEWCNGENICHARHTTVKGISGLDINVLYAAIGMGWDPRAVQFGEIELKAGQCVFVRLSKDHTVFTSAVTRMLDDYTKCPGPIASEGLQELVERSSIVALITR